MARGRKKALSLREQLDLAIHNISKTEEKLKDLKDQKKDLEEQLKSQKLMELNHLIEESGMTIEDVTEMISKEEKE